MKKENSIWTQKNLNPKLFSKNKLNNNIRLKLLRIAKDFYKSLDMNFKLIDILLSGSNVSYNYTKYSDLDVHLLVNFNSIDVSNDILTDLFKAKKTLWNEAHEITIKGHKVELYIQNLYEKHISDGVYSLVTGKWIKEPKYTEPKIDKKAVLQKTKSYVKKIDSFEQSSDEPSVIYKQAQKFKDDILDTRKAGLAKDGTFSIENLVFKLLRNMGHIERLNTLIDKTYDSIYTEGE